MSDLREQNPYASPASAGAAAAPEVEGQSEAERIRRDHIGKEGWMRGIGGLWAVGGALNVLAMLAMIARMPGQTGVALALLAGAAIQLVGGVQLARLRAIGRLLMTLALILRTLVASVAAGSPEGMGQAIGGALIPALILATLWTAKANTVLSDHYRLEIIPATPHIKRRTATWVWVLFIILLVLLVGVVAMNVRANQ